jgi:tRNA nucleotidyltransferase/poly(A) polymerase
MAGSSTVDVKKKCRLGGLGNTSVACNQGDIKNLDIKPLKEEGIIEEEVNEEVSVKDVRSNIDSIKSVLNNKRNVGFAEINKAIAQKLEKKKISVIPTRMTSHQTMMAIIYRDKINAYLLYEIVKRNNGYIADRTPEEAREIGRLLEYKPSDVENYVRNKYGSKVPIMPDKSPDDFDDLAEQVLFDFWDLNEEDVHDLDEKIDMNKLSRGVSKDEPISTNDFPLNKLTVSKRGIIASIQDIKQDKPSTTNEPVLVFYNIKNKTFLVEDGYHRVAQAYLNKEKTIPVEIYSDNYSDYVANISPENKFDLTEQDFSTFQKQIEKDIITHELDKKFIRNYQDGKNIYKVFVVNGDQVRDSGFIEWVDGGNHWVDVDLPEDKQKYAKNIPENEYWIDDVFMIKPNDFEAILLHERIESFIIRHYGYNYGDAHEIANKIELMFRKKMPDGANRAVAEKIYDIFVANFKPEKSKEKHKSVNESTDNMLNEAQILGLNYLPFREDVEEAGGKIYSVGGAVRDEFLGKESKDLDILITGVPFEQLEQILGKYGTVNAVGKSFGVLKFKPKGATEDIDIAIPRTETPTGEGGHQGFDVKSDHALPIEKDLERRDFTINAIAKDIDGNIVDPFGGQEDLKNKIIKVVNPQAFSDDPLRMLRAVQFASRFGFTIEPETMKMIQDNAGRVKEIAPERILTEFDKIIRKGNILTGVILLDETGLLKVIFGRGLYYDFRNTKEPFDKVRTMGEFVYLLSKNLVNDPAEFYKINLKGDENAYREIKALQLAFESGEATNLIEARSVAHNMYVISPTSLQSQILPNVIKTAAQELLQGKYPKTVNELAVNGNDLMQAGLQGKAIGDMQKSLLLKIYANKAMNNKEELLSLAKQEKPMIKEEHAEGLDWKKYGNRKLYFGSPSGMMMVVLINVVFDKETNTYLIEMRPLDSKFKGDIWTTNMTKEQFKEFIDNGRVDYNHPINGSHVRLTTIEKYDALQNAKNTVGFANAEEIKEENNELNKNIVYHGTSEEHNFNKRGNVFNGTFFSTVKNEAEAYGKYVYTVELKPNLKLFNTLDLNDLRLLMNEFGILYDNYYDEETEPENYYIKTPEQLYYNYEDNWNPIERTDGVLDWLDGNYDGVWVYEGGEKNLLLFNPVNEKIKNITKENSNMIKEEKASERIEYGCLMLFLDVPIWSKITSIIDKNDIYDKEGYGIENEPHTTILYGFHDEVTAENVFDLYKAKMPLKPIEIGIKGISVFKNPEFDVVKFDVDSEVLKKLNEIMKELPNTSKFPDYHAHITIAYVNKGEGDKYIKPFEKERMLKGNELVYTWKGHKGKEDGEILSLNEKGLLKEFSYDTLEPEKTSTWNINGQKVGIPFFVEKYDEWNHQGGKNSGYKDPSESSVLEFIQNNYEDLIHDEKLKKELLWALTDRELLNEGKSDYSDAKTALMRSKSIDVEMKEKILKYFTGGSTYKEGGHVHGLTKPKELMDKTPKAEGVSMGADKDGFFVYTHRARSKSHELPEKITMTEINFIESTG